MLLESRREYKAMEGMEKITRSRSPIISRVSCCRYIRLVKHPERQGTDCPVLLHKDPESFACTERPNRPALQLRPERSEDNLRPTGCYKGSRKRRSSSLTARAPRWVVGAPCISWFADPITSGFLKAEAVTLPRLGVRLAGENRLKGLTI